MLDSLKNKSTNPLTDLLLRQIVMVNYLVYTKAALSFPGCDLLLRQLHYYLKVILQS